MQIVIPMSGTGQRFLNAGYKQPKPLIEVDARPMIEHVVRLFPGEMNFIFICNNEHLAGSDIRAVLEGAAPKSRVIGIAPHKKGPVFAVMQVLDQIDDDEETIVNYCDFSKYWDYRDFLEKARSQNADGAISAYKGFHPHMLGTMNYAFMRNDGCEMLEIREKRPFTDNRMQEYASDGTYYFKKGSFVKKYFKQLLVEDVNTNGEYYVSMVYNLMKRDGLKVFIYEIAKMLQWGTPRDMEEYKKWSEYFEKKGFSREVTKRQKGSINLIPLAGRGARFLKEGYACPKPLIRVNGKPMVVQAADSIPEAEKYIFVCLAEHLDNYPLEDEIKKEYPAAKIVRLEGVTEGQACTCEIGLEGEDLDSPLLIAACDNGAAWDAGKYEGLINDNLTDVVVWSFRRHPSAGRNPQMYGWLKVDGRDNVTAVSVKKPVSNDPYNDHAIVGAFYFKRARLFLDALERMYKNNDRINREFYVDSCIGEAVNMGLRVKVFEVASYICWGTPEDLKTYEYWQDYFHRRANKKDNNG